MESVPLGGRLPRRGKLTRGIMESLRDLNVQLSLLNQKVGGQIELRGTDLSTLDLISRGGPISPSALAKRAALHPATLTGILDRLERGGWIVRGRDPGDRRGVLLVAEQERGAEIATQFTGMMALLGQICAGYSETELELIIDFLRRTAEAGRTAADQLPE
jgi:DNA-binding MarR family transcriptional regulator